MDVPTDCCTLTQVIEELVEGGSFNGINFCLTCMVSWQADPSHQV